MEIEPDQDPISLDELAQAFAQVMGASPKDAGEEPRAGVETPTTPDEEPPSHETDEAPDETIAETAEDSGPVTPSGILEAMLFVGDRGNRALTAAKAAELMRGVEPSEVPGLVQELNRRYRTNGCPYYVAEGADGFRLTLHRPFFALRERFFARVRQARLSQAAIDILAIVAYQQPLTAEQINGVRGKPGGHVLSQLVHRGLLRIERRSGSAGRGKRLAVQYFTTDRFLKLFGLETLADLPQSEEVERQ